MQKIHTNELLHCDKSWKLNAVKLKRFSADSIDINIHCVSAKELSSAIAALKYVNKDSLIELSESS